MKAHREPTHPPVPRRPRRAHRAFRPQRQWERNPTTVPQELPSPRRMGELPQEGSPEATAPSAAAAMARAQRARSVLDMGDLHLF